MNIDDKVFKEAMDRIARTGDGLILYGFLQKTLCSIANTDPADTNLCALRQHEGRRMFALDLMTLMGEGIDASGRRDGTIIFGKRDGGDVKRRRSIREYLAEQPSEWDDIGPALPDIPATGTN